ncbi:hypothetical protein [Barrientosiimonas humi]|uniref:hypothetical protein n=1 Tax=Barrientosiimonas humi TaxID=999931 RepID=UPI00370DCEF7
MHVQQRLSLLTASLALGAAALTGCSQQTATPDAEQSGSNRPTSSAPAAPAGGTDDSSPSAEDESGSADAGATQQGPVRFGQTVTYPDKISIKVDPPKEFKPTEYAVTDPEPGVKHVMFVVTVVNKSEKPLDLSLMMLTVQSGNTEATEIFDPENKLEGAPSTKVQPGRESTFRVGFSVSDPNDIVMDVNPQDNFERADVTFTSK